MSNDGYRSLYFHTVPALTQHRLDFTRTSLVTSHPADTMLGVCSSRATQEVQLPLVARILCPVMKILCDAAGSAPRRDLQSRKGEAPEYIWRPASPSFLPGFSFFCSVDPS